MASPIPSCIPAQLTAGDTLKFTASLSDFSPSDGWVLTYSFLRYETGDQINFTATTSGSSFLVNVTPVDTQTWQAGQYRGQAYVTKSPDRYKVWEGLLEILPNYSIAGQIDTRTKAKRILDFIDSSFEKLVKKQVVSTIIEGVELHFRTLKELQDARNYWATIVNGEEEKLTGRHGRAILAKFTLPQ